MNTVQADLLEQVAGIRDFPGGAYNIRVDGTSIGAHSTDNVRIVFKEDVSGMDIYIAPGLEDETIHIPVIISASGHREIVYNDFHIGEGSHVTIVAGCGIHNDGSDASQHDGIHSFHVGKNASVRYLETHTAGGEGAGDNILNPITNVYMAEGSHVEMETSQIEGVTSTKRVTNAVVGDKATLIVREKLMTQQQQYAETEFNVELNGEDSHANVISRSVARDGSSQVFLSRIDGNAKCYGHSECDAIIMDDASVKAIPEVTASHVDAQLIHEAAIGKIAGEQITKLMTLGLDEAQAEAQIVSGFLR